MDSQKAVRLHGSAKRGDNVGSVRGHPRSLIVTDVRILQQLTICNAYTSEVPLSVVHVRVQETLGILSYKECNKYTIPLEEGDQLDFKAKRLDVGTFYATGLPKYKGSLLLVARRRHPNAVGVSFESHAFAEVSNPQIVSIDAYHGKAAGELKIKESLTPGDKADRALEAEDDLRFSSVVAVNPGSYQIALLGDAGDIAKLPLMANQEGKYVVMRIGSEGGSSKAGHYPPELIVFPNGSARTNLGVLAAFIAIALSGIYRGF